MAFPATPLGLKCELQLAGVWTDVTGYTYQRDNGGYSITRGRRSEGTTADVSTATILFNNRDGRFSPRNPMGAYYGLIGRNTPVRISVPSATSWLNIMPGGGGARTANDASLQITGDIELQADVWLATWRPSAYVFLIWKTDGANPSYSLSIETTGQVTLHWSTDGAVESKSTSTLPVPAPISGRRALKATLQVNDGAGNHVVKFYTAATAAGPWTQLGATVTTAGVTSIHAGTGNLGVMTGTAESLGKFYSAKVLNGIGGTVVTNPDFTAQSDGATSFVDAYGRTWTTYQNGVIVGRLYRFYGEISEWPSKWDVTGTDVYTPVTASGIGRRLGKGQKALKSAYYRGCTSTVAPITALQAYWPCEDVVGSTWLASGLSGQSAMAISGTPTLAIDSTTFLCSAPLPDIGTASFTGNVAAYTGTGQIQVMHLLKVPAGGFTNNTVMLRVYCGGTAARWEIWYNTSGGMTIRAFNALGVSLLNDVVAGMGVSGNIRLYLGLTQSGGNISYTAATLPVGASVGTARTATLNAQTVTAATQVVIAPNKDMSGAVVGHVTVQSAVNSIFNFWELLNSHAGESASARVARLCAEEGLPYAVIGDSGGNMPMGHQLQKTLLDLLAECEASDGGLLYELRDGLGIGYRTALSLCEQTPAVTLNYSAADLSAIEPLEDDRSVFNDVTVSRVNGSTARYVLSTGTLSTQAPPNGVGVYDTSVSVSANLDSQLLDMAHWRVHTGTVDEPRYPNLLVNLARPNFSGNATLTGQMAGLDVGDFVKVTNPPAWMPPENINQVAIGFTEFLSAFTWTIGTVAQPESPYEVGVWDDADGKVRYASDGSTLIGSHTSGATSLNVVTPSGPRWTTTVGSFPFDIMVGGERMTASACATTAQRLPNGTFDANITDWQAKNGVTLAYDTITTHSGVGSLKMTAGAGAFPDAESGGTGYLVAFPGESCTFSVWARPTTNQTALARINWYDSTSTFISNADASLAITANTWAQVTVSGAIAPADAAYVTVSVFISGTPGAGVIMYVDDAVLTSDHHQTLTVTRSVNGIVKAHASGEAVTLFEPHYYALPW